MNGNATASRVGLIPTRRVAVTGLGLVCAAGLDPEDHVDHLFDSRSGLRPIGRFSTAALKSDFGGEIPDAATLSGLNAEERAGLSRATRFALSAARRALADAQIDPDRRARGRVGLVAGICASGEAQGAENCVSAEYPQHTVTDALCARLGLSGPRATISTACASSGSALGYAYDWLQSGRVDAVLVGGADELLMNTLAGFDALGALAVRPCSPFSDGIGVTFGEAGVFLALEPLDVVEARGGAILGEILGYALTGDAYHFTKPHPAGDGLRRAIERALIRSGVHPSEVGYVNAHGTGTVDNDTAETNAARAVFDAGTIPPMSSTKAFFGHTLGPACLLETASSLLAINRGHLPPTLHYENPRAGCDLDYVPNTARPADVDVFLSNSAAFGGVNATVVAARYRSRPSPPPRVCDEVVITGVGVVSPIGHGFDTFHQALMEGRSAFAPFVAKGEKTAAVGAPLAARILDWKPRSLVPTIDLRRAEPIAQFTLVAAGLALKHAGFLVGVAAESERVGVVLGLTRGPVAAQERFRDKFDRNGPGGLGPQDFPPMVVSTITGQVAEAFQLRGMNSTLVDGTTAGLHALCHAVEVLRADDGLDALVVIAADELAPLSLKLAALAGGLSPTADGVMAYHENSRGTIPGEGAAAVVLERAGAAARRGARPLAYVGGIGLSASDQPARAGDALSRALAEALRAADVTASDVDLIVGCARGSPAYDAVERAALSRLCAGRANPCPITAIAHAAGVSEAASGLFAVAAAVGAIVHGAAPPLPFAAPSEWGSLAGVNTDSSVGNYRRVLVAGSTDAGNGAAVLLDARRTES